MPKKKQTKRNKKDIKMSNNLDKKFSDIIGCLSSPIKFGKSPPTS